VELRQLSYFIAVVRYESFTKAAKYCHVTQSTLSEQIKVLEDEIGCELLIRNNRGNHLTEAGQILYESACKIMEEVQGVRIKLEQYNEKKQGVIVLGSLSTVVISWLPDFLYHFRQKYPDIQIQLIEGSSSNLEKYLENSQCDVILSTLPMDSKQFNQLELYEEELVIILPEQMTSLAKNGRVHLKDVKDIPFILYKHGFQLRNIIVDACREQGYSPNVAFEVDHTETILRLVQSGHGVAMIPKTAIDFRNHRGEEDHYYSVSPIVYRKVGLVYPSTVKPSKTMKMLIEALKLFLSESTRI
jgi:DNA-binding transcriptional LysR family regulator